MSYPDNGPQGYPQAYYGPPPEHPQATTVLVLGVLGMSLCSFCAPFAWLKGRSVLAEIDGSGGRIGGRTQVYAGYILGIVGTCLLVSMVLIVGAAVVLMIVGAMADSSS
ncbi:hypothetical protein [Nocardia alba]|uniref:DUF4190 domain-containing protein n=1 Tax=Nocardia alba TaxID=225051 RepID=A0A4R1G8W2_9NOCA|nr:hypothetical protein [Nocardia alba]TCK00462.1 hypothetical protein DFR71_1462 [Nocardia alba]